jgi:hypothetical protein
VTSSASTDNVKHEAVTEGNLCGFYKRCAVAVARSRRQVKVRVLVHADVWQGTLYTTVHVELRTCAWEEGRGKVEVEADGKQLQPKTICNSAKKPSGVRCRLVGWCRRGRRKWDRSHSNNLLRLSGSRLDLPLHAPTNWRIKLPRQHRRSGPSDTACILAAAACRLTSVPSNQSSRAG